jgi:hypothetical protein
MAGAAVGGRQSAVATGKAMAPAASNLQGPPPAPTPSLRVILARLLLEMQGAKLAAATDALGCWTALVEFPSHG